MSNIFGSTNIKL